MVQRLGVDVTPARIGIAVVAAVVAIGAGVFFLRLGTTGPPVEETLPRASSSASAARDSPPTTASDLVVQAAGAVTKPGVYTMSATARVNDLIAAAGGLAPDADADHVELAATLTDGERVYVPRVGEAPPPSAGSSTGSPSTGSSGRAPVDLNRASAADLESLPGIGPSLAQAIIDYREQHGAFRSVDDLADVRGIGPAKMEQVRPLVRV
jgi:competence protein ComEA